MKKISTNDLRHPGYSKKYHTGKKCIEPGCNEPAGTLWGYYWCPKHDIERKKRITSSMEEILQEMEER